MMRGSICLLQECMRIPPEVRRAYEDGHIVARDFFEPIQHNDFG